METKDIKKQIVVDGETVTLDFGVLGRIDPQDLTTTIIETTAYYAYAAALKAGVDQALRRAKDDLEASQHAAFLQAKVEAKKADGRATVDDIKARAYMDISVSKERDRLRDLETAHALLGAVLRTLEHRKDLTMTISANLRTEKSLTHQ